MTSPRLTDKMILAIQPAEGRRVDVIDPTVVGLLLRVSDRGSRTWYFRYRLPDGRQPRLKLGTYPSTDISSARDQARAARRTLEDGLDPAEIARKAAAEARALKIRTFDDLTQAYFQACEDGTWIPKGKRKKDKTIASERALYGRHIQRELGRRPIGEIQRPQIKSLTRRMLSIGITTQTNHAHALIRQVFSYAVEEELVVINPVLGVSSPAPKRARERTLSDTELRAVWIAFSAPNIVKDTDGHPLRISRGVGIAVRLTALLLQRRAEIATMRVRDLDLEQGVWLIPSDNAKNGRTHAVPLPPIARQLITEALTLPLRPASPFVFPSPRNEGQASIHPDALTRAMGHTMKALRLPLAGPHDLRRTGATIMASERLRITPFVVSQVLNHITDAGGGSATTRRHYNLHTYAVEKRAALAAWEGALSEIVGVLPGSPSRHDAGEKILWGGD